MSRTNNVIKNDIEIQRHSLAHVMVMAVKELWPDIKFTIGPAIENGFYYDFDEDVYTQYTQGMNKKQQKKMNQKQRISEDDLPKIEKKMREIIKQDLKFIKKEISVREAKKIFKNQPYKLELIQEIINNNKKNQKSKIQVSSFVAELPAFAVEAASTEWALRRTDKNQKIIIYLLSDFIDLCKGPHVVSTSQLNPDGFKLTKIAGAYWRGDENNKMLTRIYGIAFNTKKELQNYLQFIEESEKRDHRKIGKDQELFLIDPIVGQGLALWQPKGAMLWQIIEDFWYKEHLKANYELVRTPHIGNRLLWEMSGHWGFYSDSMYPTLEVGQSLEQIQKNIHPKIKEEYLLKPMNCPFHIMLYRSKPRSYRDLPIRWAECGTVYRYEKSGELSGLTRVRGFTQDDAHIICAPEQAEKELKKVLDFIIFIFKSFGFHNYKIYLSTRDPASDKYIGSDKDWRFAEKILEKTAKAKKLNIIKDIGGAVFYGPKLDFKIKDCLGREWQCSTLQYDFNLPEKFDIVYVDKFGERKRPYILHRALFGSFERFIGLLIEHYMGAFPVWLSPTQIKIISVSEKHIKYCDDLAEEFKNNNLRVEVDNDNETVGNKIRKAIQEKIPYILVIGNKEIKSKKLSVREREIKQIREINKSDFIKEILYKTSRK